ncbi:sodium-dependent transporter [Patescibacteria group bacterium]|nr:sodium-dependent transporter [Patescibacteria group bacterium]
MVKAVTNNRERWQSKWGFILASAGSAVGLGNFWRFSYLAGMNGGAAFILVYLVSVLVIGIPLMIAEFLVGKLTGLSIVSAFRKISGNRKLWVALGLIGVIASFVTLGYYAVIGGWVVSYLGQALSGNLPADSVASTAAFGLLSTTPALQVVWYTLFSLIVAGIVSQGVRAGIEKYNRILMLMFLVLLTGMAIYALTLPGAREALGFMFKFDLNKITPLVMLLAVGHTFFSLSLGTGIMIAYGSYLPKKITLPFASVVISIIDAMVALLAGIVIFSIVFSFGLLPDSGTGIAFVTLPPLFAAMPGGVYLAAIFFFMLAAAAITSAVSILEVVATYLMDEWKISRRISTWGSAIFIYLFGLIWTANDITLVDKIAGGYLLVLGALAVSLLIGWTVPINSLAKTLQTKTNHPMLKGFYLLNRYLIPVILICLLVSGTL